MDAVVVGGGVAGLVSALLLSRHGVNVSLIERNHEIGGLLRSIRNVRGEWFDYGTHVLSDTSSPELNQALFEDLASEDWVQHPCLKTGNYFAGRLNPECQFVDVRSIPQEMYHRGVVELLEAAAADRGRAPERLSEQLEWKFGSTFAHEVFAPIIRKCYGEELDELAVDTHILLGLSRLVAFSAPLTRMLKRDPALDERLAYHSYLEGAPDRRHYYPRRGGVGLWVEGLRARLERSGVSFHVGRQVTGLIREGRAVHAVSLDDGTRLACDLLIWTVPVHLCLSAAGIEAPTAKVGGLSTILHHFAFDRPFETDAHYLWCHDSSFESFRVTLYPNLTESVDCTSYTATVEVLSRSGEDPGTSENIHLELIKMGVVHPRARLLYAQRNVIRFGFPVPTPDFQAIGRRQLDIATTELENVRFLGRASGNAFLMNDVMLEVLSVIEESLRHIGA